MTVPFFSEDRCLIVALCDPFFDGFYSGFRLPLNPLLCLVEVLRFFVLSCVSPSRIKLIFVILSCIRIKDDVSHK